jgi:hypothetical protein
MLSRSMRFAGKPGFRHGRSAKRGLVKEISRTFKKN